MLGIFWTYSDRTRRAASNEIDCKSGTGRRTNISGKYSVYWLISMGKFDVFIGNKIFGQ